MRVPSFYVDCDNVAVAIAAVLDALAIMIGGKSETVVIVLDVLPDTIVGEYVEVHVVKGKTYTPDEYLKHINEVLED
ncbi:MAG: hypothetical protein ACREAE_08825 [Nitrosopumilaceae archaeon]